MVDRSGSNGPPANREPAESPDSEASRPSDPADWITVPVIRATIAFVGTVLLVYALGQAVGVDMLGIVAEVLATRVGRWLLVALFALLLILVALRGFEPPSQ